MNYGKTTKKVRQTVTSRKNGRICQALTDYYEFYKLCNFVCEQFLKMQKQI